jgi:hypothetical protein
VSDVKVALDQMEATLKRVLAETKPCKECGPGVGHEYWWDCPKAAQTMNYNWHFGQFANDARREAFHERAAADPFGVGA